MIVREFLYTFSEQSEQQMHLSICTSLVLTLFAGDVHSQHCDGDVVLIGSHVLQDNRVQLPFEFTQMSRCEPFSKESRKRGTL